MRTDTELQLLLLNKSWNWVSLALATFLQNTNFTFAKKCYLLLYLQWTVTFAMASTGLSTPLLAVHWYRIILSGVPGLLTFKTVMDDPWGKTLESPTCVHVIIGEGFPEALQDNVTLLPSTIVRMASETFTNGATEENRTKHTMLEKILGKDFRVEFFSPSHS